jgi:hypothetical protein
MTSTHFYRQATAACDRYRTLLADSGAIASHRDLHVLFHERAGSITWCVSMEQGVSP